MEERFRPSCSSGNPGMKALVTWPATSLEGPILGHGLARHGKDDARCDGTGGKSSLLKGGGHAALHGRFLFGLARVILEPPMAGQRLSGRGVHLHGGCRLIRLSADDRLFNDPSKWGQSGDVNHKYPPPWTCSYTGGIDILSSCFHASQMHG